MQTTVRMPCWPIVKGYLRWKLGEPLMLSNQAPELILFQKALDGRRRHRYDYVRPDYTESISLRLTPDMRRRVGVDLTPSEVFTLNQAIKDFAYERVFDFLDLGLMYNPGFQIKWGIFQMLELMGMPPDDASYEAIAKAYYRKRKKTGGTAIKLTWSRSTFNAAKKSDSPHKHRKAA